MIRYFRILFLFLLLFANPNDLNSDDESQPVAIVIHGGAGWFANMPQSKIDGIYAGLEEALDVGFALLENGNSSLDACLLYTSPSPRDQRGSRMPSSA